MNFVEQVVLICNLRFSLDALNELYAELIQYPPRPENFREVKNNSTLKEQIES